MTSKLTRVLPLVGAFVLPAFGAGIAFAQATTPSATPPAAAAPAASTPAASTPAASSPGTAAPARIRGVEARITRLHDELKITSAQEGAFQALAQVMRDNAHVMRDTYRERQAKLASMTAADAMQSYAGIAQAHAESAQKMAAAFQPLYAQLSPEQKQTADRLFRAHADHRGQHARGAADGTNG
jgi:hypothetical protein